MSGAKQLADYLKNTGVISAGAVYDAFSHVDRRDFMSTTTRFLASADMPVSIGYGQTIPQPYTVAFMLQLLDPQPGQKILDVGSGSGWTSVLLGHIVGKNGRVYGVERIPQLVERSRKALAKYHMSWVTITKSTEGVFGLSKKAPFDRILVSAAANELPETLINQLAAPGRLVMPVGNSIMRVDKDKTGQISVQEFPGFVFVPLIKQ